MPFDGLPEGLVSDLVKLRVACAGLKRGWTQRTLGGPGAENHCALGWLLVAAEWDEAESTRLALDYVYPALPKSAQQEESPLRAIFQFNDRNATSHRRMVKLFEDAIALAEKAV